MLSDSCNRVYTPIFSHYDTSKLQVVPMTVDKLTYKSCNIGPYSGTRASVLLISLKILKSLQMSFLHFKVQYFSDSKVKINKFV